MYDQHDVETLERQFNAAMEEADTGSALDAVRRIYDEFERGGAGLEALLHPDFQIRMETVFIEGKSYKGMKGFTKWRGDMEELFESDSFRPEGLRSAEDGRWVVLGRLQIVEKEKEGGDELDVPLAHVLEQRDKKVAAVTAYSEISAALESVGLPV
jgi:ketosteroid isomerase-like protein